MHDGRDGLCVFGLAGAQETVHYPAGKSLFDAQCAVCHQAGGRGRTALAPPLTEYPGKYATAETGRAQLVATLLHGMFGEIKVRDKHYNFKMPSFASASDDDIAHVLNYVVFDINAQHGDAKPFTAADIRAARAKAMDGTAVHAQREVVIKGLGQTLACAPRVGDAAARTRCAMSSWLGSVSRRLSSLLMLAGAVAGLTTAPAHADGAADAASRGSTGCSTAWAATRRPAAASPAGAAARQLARLFHASARRARVRDARARRVELGAVGPGSRRRAQLGTHHHEPRRTAARLQALYGRRSRRAPPSRLSDVATVRAGLVRALQARGIDGVTDRY